MSSTKIVKLDPISPQHDYLKEAANVLSNGGLVIIPTETVYGIAASLLNKKTLDRLYEIKKRPKDKPFSLHIVEKNEVEELAKDIPVCAYKLMDRFWPGPLTLILKAKDTTSLGKQYPTIGLRMPDNKIATSVIGLAGVPVVCPSANISGNPAAVNFQDAIKDLNGLVDFAIDAGATDLKMESSVVDLTVLPPEVLREAAIKREEILNIIKKKTVLFVCTGNSCRSVMAKALLEKKLKEKNRNDVEVLSAGIMMLGGLSATEETKEVLRNEGIDVSGHRSQRITRDIIKKSDIILIMDKLHEARVLEIVPEVRNRLFLLKEFARISGNNLDIVDPIGKPLEFYEKTFDIIKEAVARASNII